MNKYFILAKRLFGKLSFYFYLLDDRNRQALDKFVRSEVQKYNENFIPDNQVFLGNKHLYVIVGATLSGRSELLERKTFLPSLYRLDAKTALKKFDFNSQHRLRDCTANSHQYWLRQAAIHWVTICVLKQCLKRDDNLACCSYDILSTERKFIIRLAKATDWRVHLIWCEPSLLRRYGLLKAVEQTPKTKDVSKEINLQEIFLSRETVQKNLADSFAVFEQQKDGEMIKVQTNEFANGGYTISFPKILTQEALVEKN